MKSRQVAPDPHPPAQNGVTSVTAATRSFGWGDHSDAMSVMTRETRASAERRRPCSIELTVVLVLEVVIIIASVIILATTRGSEDVSAVAAFLLVFCLLFFRLLVPSAFLACSLCVRVSCFAAASSDSTSFFRMGSGDGITFRTDIGALICGLIILLGMLMLALLEIVTNGTKAKEVLLVYLQITIHFNAAALGALTLLGHATWLLAQLLLILAAFAWVVGCCGGAALPLAKHREFWRKTWNLSVLFILQAKEDRDGLDEVNSQMVHRLFELYNYDRHGKLSVDEFVTMRLNQKCSHANVSQDFSEQIKEQSIREFHTQPLGGNRLETFILRVPNPFWLDANFKPVSYRTFKQYMWRNLKAIEPTDRNAQFLILEGLLIEAQVAREMVERSRRRNLPTILTSIPTATAGTEFSPKRKVAGPPLTGPARRQ
eukprot:g17576.t1